MSDYFYDGQVRRYLTQFIRIMSNFSYKDAKGKLVEVPVRYGDMNRQVASIINKNSENIIQSAPFIACYIKDLQHDRVRMQDPTFVSRVNVRERDFIDGEGYQRTQGGNYTVERLMPTPYIVTFSADIWTTNTDQKLQLWEQITVLFNPSLELQTTDNYIDWTSLTTLELTSQTFETRSVPQGLESDLSICNLQFTCPIWISPPAKVKKLGIITKIISDLYISENLAEIVERGAYSDMTFTDLYTGKIASEKVVVTPGNYSLVVMNHGAALLSTNDVETDATSLSDIQKKANWYNILDVYPGQFKAGLSQLRLRKADDAEIVAYVTLNPLDDFSLSLNIDTETVPSNTIINGRGTVDAIINPLTFKPTNKVAGTRFLILDDINPKLGNEEFPEYNGPNAWKNLDGTDFKATGNDIIEWDGNHWTIIFSSLDTKTLTYITNTYTGIQYKWDSGDEGYQWTKSYEGIYEPGAWRLIL